MAGVQTAFQRQVKSLSSTIEEMGNPFVEQSDDLLVLDTRNMLDTTVGKTIKPIKEMGKTQYAICKTFVTERLEKRTTSLYEPIRYWHCSVAPHFKDKIQIASIKSDCSLFARLYASCQVRDRDLDWFFCHENQSFPPALTQFGELRSGMKSDLLSCFEMISPIYKKKNHQLRLFYCKYAESWCIKDIRGIQSSCVPSIRESSARECPKRGCCLGHVHRE